MHAREAAPVGPGASQAEPTEPESKVEDAAQLYSRAAALQAQGRSADAVALCRRGLGSVRSPGWRALFQIRLAEYESSVAFSEPLGLLHEAEGVVALQATAEENAAERERLAGHVFDASGRVCRSWGLWNLASKASELAERASQARATAARNAAYYRKLACHVFGARGQLYLDWGLLDLASESFEREREAVRALLEAGTAVPVERIASHFHSMQRALALDDLPLVERAVAEASAEPELYASYPIELVKLRLRHGLGRLEAERGDEGLEREAEDLLATALQELEALFDDPSDVPFVERIRPELALAETALLRGDLATACERLEARAAAFEGANGAELPGYALWLALSARCRTGRVERQAFRAPLAAAFERMLERWRATEVRPGGFGFLQFGEARAVLSELIVLEIEAEEVDESQGGRARAFAHYLRALDQGTLARRLDAPGCSAAELRREVLGEGAGLLAYLPAPARSHLFVVDHAEIEHFELAAADHLDGLRQKLVRHLSSPARALQAGIVRDRFVRARDRELPALAAELLPEAALARAEDWSFLALLGADLLGETPFEALPVRGEVLGTWKPVTRWPSGAVVLQLSRRAAADQRERNGIVLVAAPEPGPAARALAPRLAPLSPRTEGWDELLRGWSERTLFSGSAARAGALGLPAVRTAQVLVFFTHAVLDVEYERPAALVLSPQKRPVHDGLLRPSHVELLEVPPIVVVTACQGGAGPDRRGDFGSADFSGAFALAGAHTVVLAAAELEVEAARRLTADCVRGIAAGLAPAEALRRARAALRADAAFSDPFYSAHLRVVGLGSRPVTR